MMIDNGVYDRLGETWWDEGNVLNMLHGSCTPGRMSYFRTVLQRQLPGPYAGVRALDVGSGCGFLAEEFSHLGFQVTGVDPSPVGVEAARRHAAESGLAIDYRVGAGEELPFSDQAFDLVYCCDVLEHVNDLKQVIAETARVMKPGGLYLFDTVNRTIASKLLGIKVMQEWRWTRVADTPLHVWSMFIRPSELFDLLRDNDLNPGEIVGLGPRARLPVVLHAFFQARKGRITYGELSRRLDFGQLKSTSVSYMSYATKN
jgi:2-polyprenyl-6-hydroxyphenyl methylase / 3-demethylubiquinone-9 3-methyltransferase